MYLKANVVMNSVWTQPFFAFPDPAFQFDMDPANE